MKTTQLDTTKAEWWKWNLFGWKQITIFYTARAEDWRTRIKKKDHKICCDTWIIQKVYAQNSILIWSHLSYFHH